MRVSMGVTVPMVMTGSMGMAWTMRMTVVMGVIMLPVMMVCGAHCGPFAGSVAQMPQCSKNRRAASLWNCSKKCVKP